MGNKLEEYVLVYQLRNELVHNELFAQNVLPYHFPEIYGVFFVIRAHCNHLEPIQPIFSRHGVALMYVRDVSTVKQQAGCIPV